MLDGVGELYNNRKLRKYVKLLKYDMGEWDKMRVILYRWID